MCAWRACQYIKIAGGRTAVVRKEDAQARSKGCSALFVVNVALFDAHQDIFIHWLPPQDLARWEMRMSLLRELYMCIEIGVFPLEHEDVIV